MNELSISLNLSHLATAPVNDSIYMNKVMVMVIVSLTTMMIMEVNLILIYRTHWKSLCGSRISIFTTLK